MRTRKYVIRKSPYFSGCWVVYRPEHNYRVSYVGTSFEDARQAYLEMSKHDPRFCRYRVR